MDLATLYKIVDLQLIHNQGKSLFYKENNHTILNLNHEIKRNMIDHYDEYQSFFEELICKNQLYEVLGNIASKVIQTFTSSNQFIYLNQEHKKQLINIYYQLIHKLFNQDTINESLILSLFNDHYENLKRFLIHTNHEETFKIYDNNPIVPHIECSEYSVSLQLEILKLNIDVINEPVLDIGCGKEAHLIHYLLERKKEAYGFDRDIDVDTKNLKGTDWFFYPFKEETFGTIISHMAFSNHFIHHHYKSDSLFINYALLFTSILKSLKIGGSFIYTPDLYFMEELVSKNQVSYKIEKHLVTKNIQVTKITRLN